MLDKYFKNPPKTKAKPTKKGAKAELPPLIFASSSYELREEGSTPVDKPPKHGQIPVPQGVPGALNRIRFSICGILPHFTRSETRKLLEECGASLTGNVNEKAAVFIRGCIGVAQDKIDKAESLSLPIIDEDGLLHLLDDVGCNVTYPPIETKEKIGTTGINFSGNVNVHKQEDNTVISEKYRPKIFDELIGNQDNFLKIESWLKNFKTQKYKAILISGPPGIGKTTSAHIISEQLGYHVIEYNASDTRNKGAIESITSTLFGGSTLYSFSAERRKLNKNHVVIFDEVDGLSASDRGGANALAKAIQKNKMTPIICICNDRNSTKLDEIKKVTLEIIFEEPTIRDISSRIYQICKSEGIGIDRKNLFDISQNCGGDIRSALNSLQLWRENAGKADKKNSSESPIMEPFDAVKAMLNEKNFEKKINLFMLDYHQGPEFIHDVLKYNGSITQFADALDGMCDGDIINTTLNTDMNFDLLMPMVVTSGLYPIACCPSKTPKSKVMFPEHYKYVKTKNTNINTMKNFCFRSSKVLQTTPSVLRESTADLVVKIFYKLLNEGRETESIEFLSRFEIRNEDIYQLKNVVSFFGDEYQEPTAVVKNRIAREFNKLHSQSSKTSSVSSQDERSDYYIMGNLNPKNKKRK